MTPSTSKATSLERPSAVAIARASPSTPITPTRVSFATSFLRRDTSLVPYDILKAPGALWRKFLDSGFIRALEGGSIGMLNVGATCAGAGIIVGVVTLTGLGLKFSGIVIDSQGKPVRSRFTAKYDGKDYPVTGNPDADTIAVTRTGPYSGRSTLKKDGKVVQQTIRTVSKDGKTLTLANRGTNSKGAKIDQDLVFDKQ